MRYLIFVTILFPVFLFGQKSITPINANEFNTSMRGLYSVNKKVVWASGTGGVIMRTTNNKKWKTFKKSNFKALDFRDVHAFNKKEAIIMSSGDGCEIYKTKNGGKDWFKVYENKEEGIFFDGMDFWDQKHGLAFSDPINNQFYIIETKNGGNSWDKLESINLPRTLKDEAGFAASGTGIICIGDSIVYIGSGGGARARVFKSTDRGKNWKVYDTPLRGGVGNGIYSMSFKDESNGVVIGGNYLDSTYTDSICAITNDGGVTWQLVDQEPPQGYRSCVAYNGAGIFISCGRTGIDISYDGETWNHLSDDAYYSCVVNGSSGWLTGRKGKIAQLDISKKQLIQLRMKVK